MEFLLLALNSTLLGIELLLPSLELSLTGVGAPLLVAELLQSISRFLLEAQKFIAVDAVADGRRNVRRIRQRVALVEIRVARVEVELTDRTVVVSGHDRRRHSIVGNSIIRSVVRTVIVRRVSEAISPGGITVSKCDSHSAGTDGHTAASDMDVSRSSVDVGADVVVNMPVVVNVIAVVCVSVMRVVGVSRAGAQVEQSRNGNANQSDAEQFRFHSFLLVFGSESW